MKKTTKLDWLVAGIHFVLGFLCIHRAVIKELPLYYILAAFWLVMAVRIVYFCIKLSKPLAADGVFL